LDSSPACKTPTRINAPCVCRPSSRTLLNSPLRRSLEVFGKRNPGRSGLGVPGVVDFDTFRKKALASVAPTAVEKFAALLGLHASPEPELPFPRALGRLVCAFHRKNPLRGGKGYPSTRQGQSQFPLTKAENSAAPQRLRLPAARMEDPFGVAVRLCRSL
jgi:hypothetical protein